jgi:hypothetical protein
MFMVAFIILIVLAFVALMVVSAINHAQEKETMRRLQQRKLKVKVDAIADVVSCLEQTLPNPQIAKCINDETIPLLQQILALEKGPSPYVETSIRNAVARSNELASGQNHAKASYQKDSDANCADPSSPE